VRVIEGTYADPGGRFAIVAGRFNDFIVGQLLSGAKDAFARHGIAPDDRIDLVWVPGAYEIPLVCQRVAASGNYAAVVALGAVIRGSTPHFDYVASEVAKGVAQAGMATGVPILFGVLTTDTIEQAIERAGTKAGNNGWKAAMSAIEMASLLRAL
jgi:6,7-dimethyl-8-ribityllumazine synthase